MQLFSNMKITVNHAYREAWPTKDNYRLPQDKDLTELKKIDSNRPGYEHNYCPAFKHWHRNKWQVILKRNLLINIDIENKIINSNLNKDEYFMLHKSSNEKLIEIQFFASHLFWTHNKDIWVQILHHPTLSRYNIELIPGTFPISIWPRPLQFGFRVLDTKNPCIFIPKDTPLYYINLYSRYQDPEFLIKDRVPDEKTIKKMNDNFSFRRKYNHFSWKLIQEKLKLDRASKCPFANLFKS